MCDHGFADSGISERFNVLRGIAKMKPKLPMPKNRTFRARDHRFVVTVNGKTLCDLSAKQACLLAAMNGGANKTVIQISLP